MNLRSTGRTCIASVPTRINCECSLPEKRRKDAVLAVEYMMSARILIRETGLLDMFSDDYGFLAVRRDWETGPIKRLFYQPVQTASGVLSALSVPLLPAIWGAKKSILLFFAFFKLSLAL